MLQYEYKDTMMQKFSQNSPRGMRFTISKVEVSDYYPLMSYVSLLSLIQKTI